MSSTPMSFTPNEIWAFVIVLIGLVLTVLNIIEKTATLKQKAQAPEIEKEQRLEALEKEVAKINLKLSNDKKAIEDLQSTNALLVKGILALLEIQAHSDNTTIEHADQIHSIQVEMQQFLIAKGLNYEH